jgi:hypothetical protein
MPAPVAVPPVAVPPVAVTAPQAAVRITAPQAAVRIPGHPGTSPPRSAVAGSRARPVSGHRAAQRQATNLAWIPYAAVLACSGIALIAAWRESRGVSKGSAIMGAALLAAAVARLVLPKNRAGPLASRRRFVDVAAFAGLGAGLLITGLLLPSS